MLPSRRLCMDGNIIVFCILCYFIFDYIQFFYGVC